MNHATKQEMEDAIIEAIRDGATRFSAIKAEVMILLMDIGKRVDVEDVPYHRQIERALQRMRKAARITYGGSPKRWRLPEPAPEKPEGFI